jgi:aspartate/methionine/tyrosine aminotransferase
MPDDLIHVVYGFAKDFGLSGYKVGVLHSENRTLIRIAQDMAYFHSVSMQTQRTLTNLLAAPGLQHILEEMRTRLLLAYQHTTRRLSEHAVRFLPVEGGVVVWLDLRCFLASASFEAERRLFEAIFEDCRVNISPGRVFHCAEPGWFRLCFTVPESHRVEGLKRLATHLKPA